MKCNDSVTFQRMGPKILNGDKMTKEIIGKQPNTYTATKVKEQDLDK